MRLADRTDYALRALMVLAATGRRHTVPALAEAFGISAHHLTKVVQTLQGEGWVTTTAGRGGGVTLAAAAADITVGQVVRLMEPDLHLVECLRETGDCPLAGPCRLVGALQRARGAFLDELDRVTLGDLVRGRKTRLLQAVPATLIINGGHG
ncbi:MAG: RrF2 family transcriptional regulator [Phycisphaerales bacterium JB054]